MRHALGGGSGGSRGGSRKAKEECVFDSYSTQDADVDWLRFSSLFSCPFPSIVLGVYLRFSPCLDFSGSPLPCLSFFLSLSLAFSI